jgi:mono/diheme cytochrome c family protein
MVQPSPGAAGPVTAPDDLADPARVEAGAAKFKVTCAVAYCHGPEGRVGGGAPSLRGRVVGTPEQVYNVIANGRQRMPAWKSSLPPDTIWTVVAYVKSLEKEPPK